MSEKHLVGKIYYTETQKNKYNKYGIRALTRSNSGQGWSIDLENIEPNDLRVLADFLESKMDKNL